MRFPTYQHIHYTIEPDIHRNFSAVAPDKPAKYSKWLWNICESKLFPFLFDDSSKQCWTKHVQKSFPTEPYSLLFIARPNSKFKRVRKPENIQWEKAKEYILSANVNPLTVSEICIETIDVLTTRWIIPDLKSLIVSIWYS